MWPETIGLGCKGTSTIQLGTESAFLAKVALPVADLQKRALQ
jgi:hypothetical protein